MIKTRLIGLVEESKKYIAENVLLQWIGLICNIIMVMTMAELLAKLFSGEEISFLKTGFIIIMTVFLRIVCVKFASTASYYASREVKKTIRGLIYDKLIRLGGAYTDCVSTAEVVQLAGEGVEQLETYFGSYLPQFFYSMLAPLTLFIVVAQISLKVAVTLLICVPLIPVSIVIVQKIAKKLLAKYWGQYTALGDSFLENLQGLTTLKIYQTDELRHKEMNQEAEYFRKVTMKVLTMQLNSIIVMDIVAYGGAALGVLLAVMGLRNSSIDFKGCFSIILLSADFFLPMRQLGSFFHVAMNGMAASDKIFSLLDLSENTNRVENISEMGDICFEHVSFCYTEERNILNDINLKLPFKGFVALVGESGCGKSTIASLLMGRNTNYEGHIKVNGKELSTIKEEELMRQLTIVSHNSYLFKGTVKENLLMGNENASDDMLWQVLEEVKLADFLKQQKGLYTELLENASNLSGGQKQRLALARAILHDTPVYIFDEATSNIDVESENDIMTLIHTMAHRKTVLLISHRLANVEKADQIFVLDHGSIRQSLCYFYSCSRWLCHN